MKRTLFFVFVFFLLAHLAFCEDSTSSNPTIPEDEKNLQILLNAKCLKCSFSEGSIVDWTNGKPKVDSDKMSTDVVYCGIDHEKGKALIIGNAGSSEVIMLARTLGITFVEQTGMGEWIFTTVFDTTSKENGEFIAVMSKHVSFLLKPMPSQFHGTCRLWE